MGDSVPELISRISAKLVCSPVWRLAVRRNNLPYNLYYRLEGECAGGNSGKPRYSRGVAVSNITFEHIIVYV